MKRNIYNKICTAILFTMSVVLSWGGIIYATNNPNHFRIIGIIVSFLGYGLFCWALLRYESDNE